MMSMVASARQSLPMVVAVWLFGVVFLSSRLLITWMRARRLADTGQPANMSMAARRPPSL